MQRIRLVLPAYNEELSLPPLLARVEAVRSQFNLNLELLIVNDGSRDGTLAFANDYAASHPWASVLDLQPNRGLAGAMREGLTKAVEDLDEQDVVVTMDADDSHNPGLIFRMITQIREGSDLVIASRYRPGSRILGLAPHRKLMSSVAGWLFRIFLPIKGVRDYTCGYRAYRVSLIRKALERYKDKFIEQQGFACMAEILIKMRVFHPVVHELPFILRYDLKQGVSKMNVWRTVLQTLLMIFTSKH
ncbi:MAG: glycosyltransferase [Bacteroidales bacterium]